MNVRRNLLLLCACSLLVLPAGCIFSPDDDPTPEPPPPPWEPPATEAAFMEELGEVYEDMDYNRYLELLDQDFRILLKPETQQEFSLPQAYFSYPQEIAIREKMFSGDAGSNAAGEPVPGVTAITVREMVAETPWEESQDPEFPNARKADYYVVIVFLQGSGDDRRQMTVTGTIEFYLVSETITWEGKEQPRFRMIGQRDRTQG